MSNLINLPDVLAEVTIAFHQYETALVTNDISTLNALFWETPYTIRYGATENLYGYEAIATFRSHRSSTDLSRTLKNTVITTYGQDFATTNTEFERNGKNGRQSQTWMRFPGDMAKSAPEGWKIVSAHISFL
jgi:ketosteroid isomerase-like protein